MTRTKINCVDFLAHNSSVVIIREEEAEKKLFSRFFSRCEAEIKTFSALIEENCAKDKTAGRLQLLGAAWPPAVSLISKFLISVSTIRYFN